MNPILLKHLYSSVRRNRFFWLLTAYLVSIGLLALIFALLTALPFTLDESRSISMLALFTEGRVLYWFSSVILILTAGLLVPIAALGALSGERENRTLDLLITTTLKTRAITLGKMGSAMLSGAIYALAPLPLLMAGFWLGGVTTPELLITLLLILATMAFSIAWALYLSSLLRKTIAAVILFYGLNLAAIPLILILTVGYIALINFWQYTDAIPVQPLWIEALIQYGWVFLCGFHPIAAGLVTEVLGLEQGRWLAFELSVTRYSFTTSSAYGSHIITLPAPWIIYTAFALLGTLFLLWRTTRRLQRPGR